MPEYRDERLKEHAMTQRVATLALTPDVEPGPAPAVDCTLAWAESLTTRLCHDMAGLVATLAGTLEMVLEDHGTDTEAASLATDAARMLAVRLRLYRAAWGGGDMEQATLEGLADGLPNRARLRLDLTALDEARSQGSLDQNASRLVLCLLLAASAGMPRGGTMRTHLGPFGGTPDDIVAAENIHSGGALESIVMEIGGDRAAWPATLASDAEQPPSPAGALAVPLARMLAASIGWRLELNGDVLIATPH